MNAPQIDKVYDPTSVEERINQYWIDNECFKARVNPEKRPYSIVIPPPNVTDRLHMGHAYNNTLQDVLTRFKRMQGYEALWLPGTDHAGIATQNVVERYLLKNEGITRHDLGREKFVARVWQWREEYGGIIISQLKKLGCSCDWDRVRFTLDEPLYHAVMVVFKRLYDKGLIYRGEYIINWCPRCQTALSDDEAIHQDHKSHLWYIQYPMKDSDRFITVATTRPETMLGDTGVAVNPGDDRFTDLLGKTAVLPILEREIPIVADEHVDPVFGTGAVKVTPAHDPNDFEMGRRHDLPPLVVMNPDGTMNKEAGPYEGMDRFQCRTALVAELEKQGLLEKIEDHTHAVAHCQRCDTVLEPYMSRQWFVKMQPLAEPALKVVLDKEIQFHPEKWIGIYRHWMENVRDWCISRQLWWGHRIPVYYCQGCDHMMVEVEAPSVCEKCGGAELVQDEDVLDTWFSSWLWPFSTMGWPENTEELDYFYPTDALVTAKDIIFFWVARMVMAGLEFRGEIPFRHVYYNGMIRDAEGRKMSKSLGNGIDPLEMIERHSADAVRYSLIALSSEGQDINLDESKFELGRNFANKLWNSFRLLTLNFEFDEPENLSAIPLAQQLPSLPVEDRWILSRLHHTTQRTTEALESFDFHTAVEELYTFFWSEYCDWYLEFIKVRLRQEKDSEGRRTALAVALTCLRSTLKLLHPIIPFITEEIWRFVGDEEGGPIMLSAWPIVDERFIDDQAEGEVAFLQAMISAVRNIRGEMNVPRSRQAQLVMTGQEKGGLESIRRNQHHVQALAAVDHLEVGENLARPSVAASAVVDGFELFMPLKGLIDIEVEQGRLRKEIERIEKQLKGLEAKLSNQNFLERAPREVVERETRKKADWADNLSKFKKNLAALEES